MATNNEAQKFTAGGVELASQQCQIIEKAVPRDLADMLESHAEHDWEKNAPPPGTIAAFEFQVAWLLNDSHAILNWHGHEVVVNELGGLGKKYENLCRLAKAQFRGRGDVNDVLNSTIDDYELGGWANPFGFWTAFKRDMIDARKVAFEAKRVPLEKATRDSSDGVHRERNSYAWSFSPEVLAIDEQTAQKWLAEWRGQLHADPVFSKWERAKTSGARQDCLLVEAIRRVLADEAYMEELARTGGKVAKLTRLVAEVRFLAGCSQAEAYRLLTDFKTRYSSPPKKI
jgi:hypothetical protein